MVKKLHPFFFFFVLTLLGACDSWESVPEDYKPENAYESYLSGLKSSGIDKTTLGKMWISSAEAALDSPVRIPLPYSEITYLRKDQPSSIGFIFNAIRGQKIEVDISGLEEDSSLLFVDVFRVPSDSLGSLVKVASADSSFHDLVFEPKRESEYVLRIIPEILGGGKIEITIKSVPLLAFPVSGKDKWAIQSRFGAPREGGRRTHHGVDIFAKRHTPIIAPVNGYVTRVDTARLGGRVIWLRDWKRGNNLYFAHLEDQRVKEGKYVQRGDTIGTVGNTGNARTTPPHLHFGIYSRGPVDPFPYIVPGDTIPDRLRQTDLVGQWARVEQKVSLRSAYGTKFEIVKDFEPGLVIYIEGSSGRFLRVKQANGNRGYVLSSVIGDLSEPLEKLTTSNSVTLIEHPLNSKPGPVLNAGEALKILGRHDNFLMVETSGGETWWTEAGE